MLPAFTEQGRGDTAVLLLHGIGGGRSIWSESGSGTLRALAEAGWRAVAMDFPGYGDSIPCGLPHMAAMLQAVEALIAELHAPRLVLLGHSMGGMVAQELLAHSPQQVQGLVLAQTSAAFGKPEGDWQARFLAQRLAPLDAGLGMAGMARALVPKLVAPGTGDAARHAAQAVMATVPESSYRAALQAIAGFDRRDALAHICVPTLVLAAEHDRTAPPALMQGLAARIPGAEYRCLAGAGHIANVELPDAFNAAVLDFLQRHFRPGRMDRPQ